MIFENQQWSIKKLLENESVLNLNPKYQRGEAWKIEKQELFIDSLLMTYDVPKFFIHRLPKSDPAVYDVVDGQQRLRSIFRFVCNKGSRYKKPLTLNKKHGLEWPSKQRITFADIRNIKPNPLLDREISVSVISEATGDELRRLFLRLQMGSSLNQAELRNSYASPVGDHICSIAENHPFFKKCKISAARYKKQDYLSQALFVVTNMTDGKLAKDITAEKLKEMYLGKAPSHDVWKSVHQTLGLLEPLVDVQPNILNKKWIFVDLFVLCWQSHITPNSTNSSRLCDYLAHLDTKRVYLKNRLQEVKEKSEAQRKLMISYINAFYKDGNKASEVNKRLEFLIYSIRTNL